MIYQAVTLDSAVYCIKATDPVAVVTDFDDGLVLSQVPHDCFPTGVGRGQDVLDLPVPGHDADVFSRLEQETKAVTVKTNLTESLGQTDIQMMILHSLSHANTVPI